MAQIVRDCQRLSAAERLELVRLLLNEGGAGTLEVEEAWEEEIAARIAAVQDGRAEAVPVAEVLAALDEQLGR